MQSMMVALLLIGFIGAILLFALLKVIQIADDVRKIREKLANRE